MIRNKRRVIFLLAALACSLFFVAAYIPGCSLFEEKKASGKPPADAVVIARVGNTYLTLDELQASIPPEYSSAITRDQNIQYVRQWINTELLYQEALRLKVDHEPDIVARLEKMKKDLLSSEIISRSALNNPVDISEQAVREYYEEHRAQFVREHNVVRYESIVVDDINVAWEIRRTATHETFHEAARTHSKAGPLGTDGSAPYIVVDAIPLVLRNAIAVAGTPSITGPYRADDGFHILRVINKFEKGTIATMEEVRDDIVARLSNIGQKGLTERVLSEIRSRADLEFNIDKIPGSDVADATVAETAEEAEQK